jgi:hypothetical protein
MSGRNDHPYEILENKMDWIFGCDWAGTTDGFSERLCPECKSVYYYIKEEEVSDD